MLISGWDGCSRFQGHGLPLSLGPDGLPPRNQVEPRGACTDQSRRNPGLFVVLWLISSPRQQHCVRR
jgi:hypothetical protein